MIDVDTFLTRLYVMVDDFCQSHPTKQETHPGPQAVLSCSEVVTLALFGQWAQFPSERAFYRYAERHVRPAFPTLPDRSQFNRLRSGSMQRPSRHVACTWLTCWMLSTAPMNAWIRRVSPREMPSDVAPDGWRVKLTLAGATALGGMKAFIGQVSVAQTGLITGFGEAIASTHDQHLMETFLAARAFPQERLACVGKPAQGV